MNGTQSEKPPPASPAANTERTASSLQRRKFAPETITHPIRPAENNQTPTRKGAPKPLIDPQNPMIDSALGTQHPALPRRVLLQVIRHRLEGEDGIDVPDVDAVRDAGEGGGVVQDGAHLAAHERVDDGLRRAGGRRDDADVDAAAPQLLLEVRDRLDRESVKGRPDYGRIGVEGGDDAEALRREALVAEDRLPQPADADERHL